jgi:hypothetical protein
MYNFMWNPNSKELNIGGKGRNPQEVYQRMQTLIDGYKNDQQTETINNGGNIVPGGAGAAARPATPPPANPKVVPRLTPQALQRQAAEVIQRDPNVSKGTYVGSYYKEGDGNYMMFQVPGVTKPVPVRDW